MEMKTNPLAWFCFERDYQNNVLPGGRPIHGQESSDTLQTTACSFPACDLVVYHDHHHLFRGETYAVIYSNLVRWQMLFFTEGMSFLICRHLYGVCVFAV